MSGCDILVSGLPYNFCKTDLQIYFQSRKKSNGGDIAKIEFDKEQGEAKIQFVDASITERVLCKSKHELNGVTLNVVQYMNSTNKVRQNPYKEKQVEPECATVLVKGLSDETTEDAIQMYFENSRRSSGGEVQRVILEGNQATVTFESPSVAKKVLEWGKHTLDGCPLTVSRPLQSKETLSFTEEDSEQPLPQSRVVRVLGLSDKTTKDTLLNFFENTRRSGGGEIEDIQHIPDERLADITFCSPEDAERVSQKKSLELDGTKISLTLKEIPKEIPKDPYKLHVMGISDKTTKDGLQSFMEVVSGEEVENMLFGSNSNAMITFRKQPDLDKVQRKCGTRALDGSHLKIEQVNICDCVEVSGLAPNTTKDTVFYYFDNPRNGGGEVKNVEMNLEMAVALVFFEDPQVMNNITKKRHTINGAILKVVPYYPLLGEASRSPDEKKKRSVEVHPESMIFLNKFIRQEFKQLLQENHLKYTWAQDSGEIILECAERKMDKTSWHNSCEVVVSFIKQIVTENIAVSQEAWEVMLQKSKEKCAPFKDQVDIVCNKKKRSFTLTGKKTNVSTLVEQLNDLNSEIEKQLNYEKNKTSKNIPLTEVQIDLFNVIGFCDDLKASCKDIEVNMSKNDLRINFIGPDKVVKEGNIKVYEKLSKVKDYEMELPRSIAAIVGSEAGMVFMKGAFKKSNIDAVVSSVPNFETQILVTAVDRSDLKKAIDIVKDVTSEERILLDTNQMQLLHIDKWKGLKESMKDSMLLQVTEEPSASALLIAGIKEEVSKAKQKVECFFEENVILTRIVKAENGRVKFIFKHKIDAIKSIEKSLKNQSVEVKNKGTTLEVCGTRDGIEQGSQKIQKLLNAIKDHRVELDMPGMKKLFSNKSGINHLTIVENDHHCIIERCSPSLGKEPILMDTVDQDINYSKMICSYSTPGNRKIILYKGDITEHKVDVIVNAANKSLKHIGGVAGSIVKRGGRSIQDECDDYILRNSELLDGEIFMSGAGNLPCKRLIHAVGPRWNPNAQRRKSNGAETREERILSQTIYNSLNKAKGFTSIAFPAISSGIFGFPEDLCAQVLLESALEYTEENRHSNVCEIHFVDMKDDVIKAFYDEMRTRFGKESSFTDNTMPKKEASKYEVGKEKGKRKGRKPLKEQPMPHAVSPVRSEVDLEEPERYEDPNLLTTPQGMKVMIIVGDLAKEEAHAIVNTVSSDLDLNKNPCAISLSNAAGPGLQQECKRKGFLSPGKIFVTDGYNLGCRHVFHVVAGEWRNNQGEPVLRSLIQCCLKEADKRGFSSIAFPAIGTGKLGYPRDVVARAFIEEVDTFKGKHPQSPLNEVHLVLFHKDIATVQAFQDELRCSKLKKPTGKRRSYDTKRDEDIENFESAMSREPQGDFVNLSYDDASSSASYLGPVRLEIIYGDITKETTDAIAIVSNKYLCVSQGGVGTAIAKAGGPSIQKECDKFGTQDPGSVVCTRAGDLSTKKIFHLVSLSLKPADISEVVFKCLMKADSIGIKSIAIPAMGTGVAALDPKNAAKNLLSTIEKFSQEQPSTLDHIRIVVFQKHMLQAFYDAIHDLSKSQSGSGMWGRLWKSAKNFVFGITGSLDTSYLAQSSESTRTLKGTPASTYSSETEMWLQIFAEDKSNLKKAETDIKEFIKDNSKVKEIEKTAIGKLSEAQRERILRMQTEYDTRIQIDKKINRIVVRGANDDVSNVTVAIYDILNEKSEEEHTRKYAELLSKNVQWYYMDGSDEEPYDDGTNAEIEQAYKDNKGFVYLQLTAEDNEDAIQYKIDFNAMEEKNLNTGETTRVERKDTTAGISLPAHWQSQPKDSNGKEVDVHLVALDPVKHKKEYEQVKTAIEKTSAINIVKIERVQNPALYKTYTVKKQKMDDKNQSNEKKLFHGTATATCELINHQGFNRSFCGKNAIVFGKGVYFARDASYSMRSTYSPADPASGIRCMYMASVLVGEFTQGQQNMVTPPPKDPKYPTVTYDSVVDNVLNPSIFVVFHDTQNYPDYLITFK